MRDRTMSRTLAKGKNTWGNYSKVGGWVGSNDCNTGAVETVIIVKDKGRSFVLNGRHLLQQSLKAGYQRGEESLTVGLAVPPTHTLHTHTLTHNLNTRKETDQSL